MTHVRSLAWTLAAALLAACAPGGGGMSSTPIAPSVTRAATGPGPITHVVFIVQGERSFNDLFEAYPGADTASAGRAHNGRRIALKAEPLSAPACAIEGYGGLSAFATAYQAGRMNGWDLLDRADPDCPYTHVRAADTARYWQLAKSFTLADHTFSSTYFGPFASMQYMIAGSTEVARDTYVIGENGLPLGCDSPAGTTTTVLRRGKVEPNGPFPCFTYPTIATLLDEHHVSWKWYASAVDSEWNPWDAIKYVREGPDWKRNVSFPSTNVLSDVKNGTLASVSWVTPSLADSDRPGTADGPAWVTSVATAIMRSKYWSNTAIVVLWNNAGGGQFFDPVAPPQVRIPGLGFRVPLIAISPFARDGYVAHDEFETGGSTLHFVEKNWKLGRLHTTDDGVASIGELFSQ